MTKIFKQLGRHWAACLAVVALLIVQAYCDLSLPDYTSKIVDTGIQQGGIESPVPDTVRSTTLQALELLMSEDDAALADEAYSDPDADGMRTEPGRGHRRAGKCVHNAGRCAVHGRGEECRHCRRYHRHRGPHGL